MQGAKDRRAGLAAWLRSRPKTKAALRFVARLFVVAVLAPAFMALIGYSLEAGIYKPGRRTLFHTLYITVAAWCAAPFFLAYWYWRWRRHLLKFEFFIYVVQTVAFFYTTNVTTLTGNELYQSNYFVREQFLSRQFRSITTQEDTWRWLHDVMRYVYDRDGPANIFSRKLSGRLTMMTAIRLRQNRVKPVNCSYVYRIIDSAGADECFPLFSESTEDRETFGDHLRFPYYQDDVNSTTGYPISMEDFTVDGAFGRYPLAGSWVWFSPPLAYNDSRSVLDLMRRSNWLDEQTRAVGMDLALGLLDFTEEPVFAHLSFLVEVNRAGSFVPLEPAVNINYFYQYDDTGSMDWNATYQERLRLLVDDVNLNSLEYCAPDVLKRVLRPMYLGFLPAAVYLIAIAVIELKRDWRQYVRKPFNLTGLVWCAMVVAALAFQLQSLRYVDCGSSLFHQTLLDPVLRGRSIFDSATLRYAVRFEVLPMAATWTKVRYLLGIALFVHFFNFLQFLVKLKALGVLVRTLRFAAVELLSFSFSFLVMFVGFVLMFYYIFSIESASFRTINVTVASLWLGMLGELELTPELWRGGSITLALFIIFTFLSVFVLLTTIVSIIGAAHTRAQKYGTLQARAERRSRLKMLDVAMDTDTVRHSAAPRDADRYEEDGEDAELYGDDESMQLVNEHREVRDTLRLWRRSISPGFRSRRIGVHTATKPHLTGTVDGRHNSQGTTTATPGDGNSLAKSTEGDETTLTRACSMHLPASVASGNAAVKTPQEACTEAFSSV